VYNHGVSITPLERETAVLSMNLGSRDLAADDLAADKVVSAASFNRSCITVRVQ
jgi:hypothetical protein